MHERVFDIHYIHRSASFRHYYIKCFLFNGVIFLTSLIIFDSWILSKCCDIVDISSSRMSMYYLISTLLQCIFYITWIIPIYMIGLLLNTTWFQKMMINKDISLKTRKESSYHGSASFSNRISDDIYRIGLLFHLWYISMIMYYLPIHWIFSKGISWSLIMLITSFYAFQYQPWQKRMTLEQQLRFFEFNWSFFLGFGFSLTIITSIFSHEMWNVALYSLLFPFLITLASNQTDECPIPSIEKNIKDLFQQEGLSCPKWALIRPAIFYPPKIINGYLIKYIFRSYSLVIQKHLE